RQLAHASHRGAAQEAERADADRLGNRRRVFRREVVEMARRDDSRHAAPAGARRRADLLSRRAMGGIQRRGARALEGGAMTASSPASRAVRFRDLNKAGRLLLPNAWDAASARIFEEAGCA